MRERRRRIIALTLVLGAVLGLVGLRRLARSRTTQVLGRLVTRVETSERVVALTFDDGPSPEHFDGILDAFAARGVRATFFAMGAELRSHPELGRRLVTAGHQLGNHTYSHPRMVLQSQATIRREIEDTDASIRAAGEEAEILFRAPFCWKLFGLPYFLSRTGRTSVTWDVEPESFPEITGSAEEILVRVLERVRPGSIILLHVWYSGNGPSRSALPGIMDSLRAREYRFVTVGELLRLGRPSTE